MVRGKSSGSTAAFALTAVMLLAIAGPATAGPRRISPVVLYSATDIYQTITGVSPFDEGIVLITKAPEDAGPSSPASSLTGLSRVRSSAGAFSPVQEITRTKDASVSGLRADGSIPFTSTGTALISVNAAAAPSSYLVRKRGGQFSPLIPLDGMSNPACEVGNGTIMSDDRLFLACPVMTTGGSPTFTLGYLTSSNPLAALGTLTTGFQAASSFNQLDYVAAAGGKGNPVRALGWSSKTGANTVVVKAIVDSGVGVFGIPENIANLSDFPSYPYGRLNDVTVLGDGTVIETWEEVNDTTPTHAFKMKFRPPGAATNFGTASTLTTDTSGIEVKADGPDNRALVGWQHESTGPDDPASYWLMPTHPGSPGSGLAGPLSGSAVQAPDTSIVSSNIAVSPSRVAEITVCYDHTVKVWYRPDPGNSANIISGPYTLATAPSGKAFTACSSAVDSHGNVFATWVLSDPAGPDVAYSGGLELGTAPGLRVAQAPRKVLAGDSQTFTAAASDTSGIASVRWSFGDRSTANGASVRHRYRKAGSYRASVTAKDRAGVSSTRKFRVKVVAG